MKAQIEILTRTPRKSSRFHATGSLDRCAEGGTVVYPIEDDSSSLQLFWDRVVMKRRGSQSFDADFCVGNSFFSIEVGGQTAQIPLLTRLCKVFFSDCEIFCRLSYDLGSEQIQKFSLKIHIKVISEEL